MILLEKRYGETTPIHIRVYGVHKVTPLCQQLYLIKRMIKKIFNTLVELIRQDASYLLYLGSIIAAIAATLIIITK
jgi:hypothetical protein